MGKKDINFITANRIKTPIAFFDENRMLASYNIMRDNLANNIDIYYAIKSCYNLSLLKAISTLKIGAEVLSELEFKLALKSNFKKIILNGMGRSFDFLEHAILHQSVCVILDTDTDIKNIKILAQKYVNKKIFIGIRYNLMLNKYKDSNHYFSFEHKLGNKIPSFFFQIF